MASLPQKRVSPSPSGQLFQRTGPDYAGPFMILTAKESKRATKTWVAVFVYLASKLIHLELVGDLTTDSLLRALERFSGRTGDPSEIWSDNVTHFHRADLEIREAFARQNVTNHLAEKER
uniref:Integrase catalytic domain-containing protein n=1 Tax=Trichogramma kaykai TaxID=54128 RepID=A0ABD2XQY7_9HYME